MNFRKTDKVSVKQSKVQKMRRNSRCKADELIKKCKQGFGAHELLRKGQTMTLTAIQSCPDLEECAAAIHGAVNTALLHNSLKIMEGKFGGGFYARYIFDNNYGTGYIQLLLQYPDGAVVPVPLCKNMCKIATDENAGVETAVEKPHRIGKIDVYYSTEKCKIITPKVKEGVEYSSYIDYFKFIKYERPDFPIPMKIIWERIVELWEQLPTTRINKVIDVEDVYISLFAVGQNKAETDEVFADTQGVFLTKEEIEEVAFEYGYDFKDIRRIFENRNLWVKDSNTAGYQYSKRVNGKLKRFYKLRKVRANEKVQVEEKYCMEYTE